MILIRFFFSKGKEEFFPEIKITEEFKTFGDRPGISLKVPVVPEYSYIITGSFVTPFGRLSPSPELRIPGEFENMMKDVGCFVRNEYIPPKKSSTSPQKYNSSIDCAQACYDDENCGEGWSFQIATKKCFFQAEVEIEKLQPGSSLMESERKIGWATGLKSCSTPGAEC